MEARWPASSTEEGRYLVVAEARAEHGDKAPLGVAGILATDPMTRKTPPPPPWHENRRHMVVWDDHDDPEVRNYIDRYWTHQIRFRAASDKWLSGDLKADFPPGSYLPGLRRPLPHIQSLGV